jgi:hypothetical protein
MYRRKLYLLYPPSLEAGGVAEELGVASSAKTAVKAKAAAIKTEVNFIMCMLFKGVSNRRA